MIRCALYARYSSDQQRPESIADQIRECRQEAARHPDWVILDEHLYADEVKSGVSVEGRAGLARLVQAALHKPRPFDLILVDDTSRLARDVVDSVQNFRELRFHGVDLYFVNQGLHSRHSSAEFLITIYGAIDSEYIRELGRKTHRGLEGQARKGFSAGGIAYGYRREPVYDRGRIDRDGRPYRLGVLWVIEPDEAKIVCLIFLWYAEETGMAGIAARLNKQGIPSPRQAKGHRPRQDGVGAGWDVSSVRAILSNEVYRGRLIWNRFQWVRDPGTRRRRRVPRDPSQHVIKERPELRIIDEELWERVQARRACVRERFDEPSQFGRARSEYRKYILSGLLVCAACGALLSVRSGSSVRGDQRYGCPRRWRRGKEACSNNVLVRRDFVEQRIIGLLREKLYHPEAVQRLVDKVNSLLGVAKPQLAEERDNLIQDWDRVRQRLDGLRRFVEGGDTSAKVREWLRDAEREEGQAAQRLAELEAKQRRSPIKVHHARVQSYLQDLRGTLEKREARARELLRGDVERIVIHPVREKTAKPFARAEVITSGKGLLERVAFMVAGAGFEPATFGL